MRAPIFALATIALATPGCSRASPPTPTGPAPSASASTSTAEPAAPTTTAPATAASTAAPSASAAAPAAPAGTVVPSALPMVAAIDEAANGAVARGEVPGAVVAVVRSSGVVFLKAYGLRAKEPEEQPMTVDTVFDLASLTKVVATAPCIHLLAERGKIQLGAPVARYLPAFGKNGKEAITVEQLLLHTGGLLPDNAITDYKGGRAEAFARIHALPLSREPGEAFEYSDVGYIVLGELVEAVSGQPLDVFAREQIFAPLGMNDTTYNPPPPLAQRTAPTEPREGRMLKGEVHDPRAALLGGVAGHAGLFSTAADLARFAAMLLGEGRVRGTQILAPATFRAMVAPHELPGEVRRTLGWDVWSGFSNTGGYAHTGFTGTLLRVDPRAETAIIVLTSRLHPEGKGDPRRLRAEVTGAAARGLRDTAPGAGSGTGTAAPATRVLTGIDVLARDGFALLQGKRVGLVTNASGVDAKGARTVDVLRAAPGVTLSAIFAPEHGLAARADGAVGDGRDERTGVVVYSLFGKRTRPSAAELQDVDTLVFDLADAGARFFTYETTLGYLLETAAEQKKPIVVLDRPDPIGGLAVEGPVLEAGRTSFIGYHPAPVRHGMTLGELARLWNAERGLGADLTVVRVEGWRRGQLFDATGLPWMRPSPNLHTLDEALLYPGVALLEATNVSVGRGTPRPFELVGAPWIDGARLAAALATAGIAGARFTATTFTPSSGPFKDERCEGVQIAITDRARFEPVRMGLAIAAALLRLHRDAWEPKNVLTLLGHQPTFAALLRGDTVASMVSGWQADLGAFLAVRKKYLLYPE